MIQLKENAMFGEHNRYRLIRLLGHGGFSEVWLADDTQADVSVALKVYAPGRGLDDDGVKQFSSEFSLVFNLNHSNLLRPTHYDVFERMPYLIMPYCEQGSSYKQVGKIDENTAWKFLHDVASGLAYLHTQKPPVIHQDIKPDNVLMDNNGTFLITDFGISSKARSTLRQKINSRGQESSGAGAMAYMAPERFSKDNQPIMAGDVWALGASLYELMTGQPPFGEHGGLLLKGGADIPDIPGEWSSKLKKIIHKCLQKETWDRPKAQDIVKLAKQYFKPEDEQEQKVEPKANSARWKILVPLVVILGLGLCVWFFYPKSDQNMLECLEYIEKGDEFAKDEASWNDALTKYIAAKEMKDKHHLKLTDKDIEYRIHNLQKDIDHKFNDYERRAENFMKDGLKDQAIFYLEKALVLKDVESVREKLNQLKK